MADKPHSFRGTRVSRRTVVIKKAASEDARRHGVESGRFAPPPAASAAQPSARESSRQRSGKTTVVVGRKDARVVSGRFISRREDGARSSVRVKGGDTLIRLKDGGTLVRRRAAPLVDVRRRVLLVYGLGYLIVFGCYLAFLISGTWEMTPEAYLNRAFAKRHGDTIDALRLAAIEATRGYRTPAEVRFAQEVSFYDAEKELIKIGAGNRITLLTAAKLGDAVIDDLKRDEKNRTFNKPFVLYKETWLASVDWPYWLMFYNLVGFFILCLLYLWKPIMDFLGTQGKKTAIALENARNAQEEAEKLRDGYRQLAADIETRRANMEAEIKSSAEAAHEEALQDARRQAEEITGGVESAIEAEAGAVLARLKSSVAAEACQRAKALLTERVGQEDHDRAVDDLIADIAGMKF